MKKYILYYTYYIIYYFKNHIYILNQQSGILLSIFQANIEVILMYVDRMKQSLF